MLGLSINFTYETLSQLLYSIGYANQKKISSNKIAVLTDENRVDTLEKIQKYIKGSIYDRKPTSASSVGFVKVNNKFFILAKPAKKQGKSSAGVDNEQKLVDFINSSAKTGPINVFFMNKNKTFDVIGCVEAISAGTDTSGRKKSDVNLIDYKGKVYPISIKKDDAEYWESADSYFGQEAKTIIDKAIKDKKTQLIAQTGNYFTIEPNIAVEATRSEKQDVVFGSDIQPNGCVITKTFSNDSFEMREDTLLIEVSNIIENLSDVKGDKDVYFLIRNDKTRKSIKEYPGIRILAAYKKRINKNVVIVNRDK